MKLVTFLLPEAYLEGVDRLVGQGMYQSRSAAIRHAVMDMLRRELWRQEKGAGKEGIATRRSALRLLRLPDSLQKTMTAVVELGEATADIVAAKTGRRRSTESNYLNRLVKLTYLKKRRVGRKIYFSPT